MAQHSNYWTCTPFADWLRGTAKPGAATMEEWQRIGALLDQPQRLLQPFGEERHMEDEDDISRLHRLQPAPALAHSEQPHPRPSGHGIDANLIDISPQFIRAAKAAWIYSRWVRRSEIPATVIPWRPWIWQIAGTTMRRASRPSSLMLPEAGKQAAPGQYRAGLDARMQAVSPSYISPAAPAPHPPPRPARRCARPCGCAHPDRSG